MKTNSQHALRGIAMRCLAVLCIALMSAAMKLAGDAGASAIEMLFFRSVIGAPLVFIFLAMGPGIQTIRTRRPGAHILRGLLGMGAIFLLFKALILLPIADAVTIGFSTPAFATILSALVLREHVGRHRWFAVVIGFVGILLVMQPGGQPLSQAGIAYAMANAVTAAAAIVTIRQIGASETTGAIVFWFFITGLALSSVGMAFSAKAHEPSTWALLVAGGVVGAAAQLLLTKSLQLAPVGTLAPFDYTQIIWAVALGWLLWSTAPGWNIFSGAALIIASGLYTGWREHRQHKLLVPPSVSA